MTTQPTPKRPKNPRPGSLTGKAFVHKQEYLEDGEVEPVVDLSESAIMQVALSSKRGAAKAAERDDLSRFGHQHHG